MTGACTVTGPVLPPCRSLVAARLQGALGAPEAKRIASLYQCKAAAKRRHAFSKIIARTFIFLANGSQAPIAAPDVMAFSCGQSPPHSPQ